MATKLVFQDGPMLDGAVVTTPYQPGNGFPLFLQPTEPSLSDDPSAARAWFNSNRDALEALLVDAGALVFRGFAVRSSREFSDLMGEYFEPRRTGYVGGAAVRKELVEKVYETSNAGPERTISMHQEMMYDPAPPTRLCFFCHVPSVTGGETFVADMRRVTAALPASLIRAADERGVRYRRNYREPHSRTGHPSLDDVIHRDWQSAFSTTERDEATAKCRAMGLEAEWLADGSLSTTYLGPGLARHPLTGEKVWFNGMVTNILRDVSIGAEVFAALVEHYGDRRPWPYLTTYGDGEPVPPEDLAALDAVFDEMRVAFPYSAGDMLLIDNYSTAHGRNSFTGLRDVQVALFK